MTIFYHDTDAPLVNLQSTTHCQARDVGDHRDHINSTRRRHSIVLLVLAPEFVVDVVNQ